MISPAILKASDLIRIVTFGTPRENPDANSYYSSILSTRSTRCDSLVYPITQLHKGHRIVDLLPGNRGGGTGQADQAAAGPAKGRACARTCFAQHSVCLSCLIQLLPHPTSPRAPDQSKFASAAPGKSVLP